MNTKEWLTQGKYINKEIRALKDALSKAEHFPEKNENCAYYKNILESKIDELSKTNSDIISAIYKVEDNIPRTLLIERFAPAVKPSHLLPATDNSCEMR